MAVAVFRTPSVVGEAVAQDTAAGCLIRAHFDKLPPGNHGFHIHVAGDLRGEGCAGACAHWHKGPATRHGDRPRAGGGDSTDRHTGDLGNVTVGSHRYLLAGVRTAELWGRTLIVHADEDDLGRGPFEDSPVTGHSGARIACAIFGRVAHCSAARRRTRRRSDREYA